MSFEECQGGSWCGRQEPEKVEGHLPTLRSFVDFLFRKKSICKFVGCWGKQKMQFSFVLFFENRRIRTAIRHFFHNEEHDHGNNENENVACRNHHQIFWDLICLLYSVQNLSPTSKGFGAWSNTCKAEIRRSSLHQWLDFIQHQGLQTSHDDPLTSSRSLCFCVLEVPKRAPVK